MLPPELQPRLFRPHISSTSSSSEQASSSPNYSPHMSPASTRSFIDRRTSGATSRSSNSRFSPSSFAYNGRIALALVPCAAFLLDLGGAPVIATLTVGLLISYIVDSLDVKFGAFLGIWMSLITAQIAFFFSSSLLSSFNSLPLGLLAAFLCAETTFLIGCWTSLQFKWLQLENPSIVVALERLLFACAPFTASSLFAWATISAVGMSSSSYYFLVFACVFYWLFAIPRVSSFKTKQEAKYLGGEIPEDNYILGSLESSFLSLNLMFMPLLFHVASHYSVMFSSAASVSDLLLLFFVPFLFQLYASTRGGLWWVTKDSRQLQSIRIVNGAVALVVIVICLEIRVVFRSFGKYIQVPPPLNYLLVTTTMLGGAAGAGASVLGMISSGLSSAFFTALAVIVSSAGAIVVGFPLLFTPLPAVAGLYFARFFTKKSVPSYFAFVALGSLMVIWFVMHNYWDLNIWLAGMFLKSFCKLIVANIIIAMVIPGLVLLPSKFHFLAEADDVMYPSYMVISTTLIGLAVVRRLFADHRIGSKAVWILTCLYSSKLAMLFLSSKSVVWVSAALLLAVSPPLLLYKEKSKSASKMKPWQGYAHALVVAISVWFCRETIFDALQWWNGRPPSDGLLLGFCIVLIGLACIPIVALHFSHVLSAKRSLVLVVATGCMFILMQPPMPMTWSYHSEMIKAARQSADDISIYGFMASKPTWPSWLLIVALLLILAAATSLIPIKYVVELRAFYSVAMGLALGVYISAEFFLQAAVLHALIVVTMVCASVFVIFTHFPSASSTKLLPWVFALLVALFPVTYLLEGQVRIKNDLGDNAAWGWDAREEDKKVTAMLAIEGARTSLLGLYAAIFMLIALLIKFELTSLLREKVSEKSGQSKTQGGASGMFPTRTRLMQQRRATSIQSFAIEKMSEEGAAWMPAVGNVATIVCFAICLILNIHISGGSSQAIFFLAPILLLLNQDSDLLSGFGDKQRYFPVTLAISTYLALSSLYVVWEEVWFGGNTGWGVEIGGREWFFAVKNLALLILTAPGHIIFNRYVWSYSTKNSDPSPMLTLPLSFAAVVITDVFQVRLLGVLGIVYSVAQYVISRQQHIKGLRYI
ncbi:BnaC09g43680D [Brassica napus]|uniref:BnaC09g43680D protein n=1 Tax=Brassica napus TaxID=3708 RepID=A0A078FCL7_BRANA|nr:BnaC09g43680D [Brassica napus]